MAIQISLVGLGQIGSSIGLALESYSDSITRIGYDRDHEIANRAREIGAIDRKTGSLSNSMRDSNIILLALPMHEIQPALKDMAQELKEGAIVIDTAPIKQSIKAWVDDMLPDNVHYVGFTPVINPEYLHEDQFGIQAARSDLFEGGMVAVVAGKGATEEVVRTATNLIEMLGAEPFFVDAAEIDGLMTMTYIMPRVLAASLLSATLSKPGWRDGRKIAGRAYARVSGPLTPVDEPASLANIVMNNRENVIRVIDDVMRILEKFRDDVEDGEEAALLDMLEEAQRGRDAWWRDRQASPWSPDRSQSGSKRTVLNRLFGSGLSRPSAEDEEA